MFALLSTKPSKQRLFILFLASFLVRAATFYFYVQHEERYFQADSNDYHMGALSVGLGHGLVRLNTGQPTFWRTPGYPWYLSKFYRYYGINSAAPLDNLPAQKAALWLQIFLCSFIPVILFYLALLLTGLVNIAWLTAWISVFHLGQVLASTFLLTEGLALIFFYLFLIYFFKSFACYGEQNSIKNWPKNLIIAGLLLGITTWIRPMGQFIAIVCTLLIALIGQDAWKLKLKKILLFLFVFFASIFPWYVRNHQLTGHWFYSPMLGTYLNAFIAPKILRATTGQPLEVTWKALQERGGQQAYHDYMAARAIGKAFVPEYSTGKVAWPIVLQHPFIAMAVWMPEVFKTTFDLYSSQLVSFANNSFKWDPLEEFLLEKIKLCLYKQPMPLWMRIICWTEFIFNIFLWLALFYGMWLFLLLPIIKKFNVPTGTQRMSALWFKSLFFIGAVVFMTGGFGYARLRLPIEPLMIILALTVVYRKKLET